MTMASRCYLPPQQFHAVFKAAAKERPLRLAADLAYFLYCAERDFGAQRPESTVTDTYQALVSLVTVSGIKTDDLIIMFICLKRFYANLFASRRYDDIMLYHQKHSPIAKAVHAAYVSQAMLYDDPLARKAWVTHSQVPFKQFLNDALDFCDAIDYDFYFGEQEMINAFNDLVVGIERLAIECYRRLAPQPKTQEATCQQQPSCQQQQQQQQQQHEGGMSTDAPARFSAAHVSQVVPTGVHESPMQLDSPTEMVSMTLACQTPATAAATSQRPCVWTQEADQLELQLAIIKRRKLYHDSAYGTAALL